MSGCLILGAMFMSPKRDWFLEFKPQVSGKVFLGNNEVCQFEGIGPICIKIHDGVTRKLTNVRYIPGRRNLISLGIFDTVSYSYKSENGCLKICKGSLVILKGVKKFGVYILLGKTICNSFALFGKHVTDKCMLWHRRNDHTSEKGLHHLSKQIILYGDKVDTLDFCDHCVLGKQHKLSFSTSTHKSSDILESLH